MFTYIDSSTLLWMKYKQHWESYSPKHHQAFYLIIKELNGSTKWKLNIPRIAKKVGITSRDLATGIKWWIKDKIAYIKDGFLIFPLD